MKHLNTITLKVVKAEHPGIGDALSAFVKDPLGTIGMHFKSNG